MKTSHVFIERIVMQARHLFLTIKEFMFIMVIWERGAQI